MIDILYKMSINFSWCCLYSIFKRR